MSILKQLAYLDPDFSCHIQTRIKVKSRIRINKLLEFEIQAPVLEIRYILVRIRIQTPDPYLIRSVADPGCLSRILIFTHPGSRISDPGSKNSNKREG
jgi:hypothetical protein